MATESQFSSGASDWWLQESVSSTRRNRPPHQP
ncbi:hypothetical protein Golob_001607 [Gossypium lobatum]|uniref:Uncharacterized protein n=1 Tax=Gossypium lobatum TaxID=34289 RepID=A0A7J8NBU4_9ROSI|nr:hypothetical protein [Gossypium lobatum]